MIAATKAIPVTQSILPLRTQTNRGTACASEATKAAANKHIKNGPNAGGQTVRMASAGTNNTAGSRANGSARKRSAFRGSRPSTTSGEIGGWSMLSFLFPDGLAERDDTTGERLHLGVGHYGAGRLVAGARSDQVGVLAAEGFRDVAVPADRRCSTPSAAPCSGPRWRR